MQLRRRTLISGIAIATSAALVLLVPVTNAGAATAASPNGQHVVRHGGNGSGSLGSSGRGRAAPDSLPGGYCGTFYEATDGTGPDHASLLSEGYCTDDIEEIYVNADLWQGSTLKKSSAHVDFDTSEADTTATYDCGTSSKCKAARWSGDDTQNFYNASGWVKALGHCLISGSEMACVGTTGSWTWP